jgi:glycosyltransferase involved in cell wall biosynthesis
MDPSMSNAGGKVTITYFCPLAEARPSGGVKVIHAHAEILAGAGIDCFVFHPGNVDHRASWFESRAPIRTNGTFDPRKDFLVIPEVWAGEFGRQFYEKGFKYAVFVQNGYSICLAPEGCALPDLRKAYQSASLILSISEDTSAMIALIYPEILPQKIVRVLPHVSESFGPGKKSKTISYMPRKLPEHGRLLSAYLKTHLPQEWELVPIHMMAEGAVAETLARSSIFLSLSDQEGFGLPPVEAALSGALVVGYTGQAGNEYFREPNFRKVENGDIRTFIAEIERAIESVNAGLLETAPFRAGIESLKARYAREAERRHLLAFAQKVQDQFPAMMP